MIGRNSGKVETTPRRARGSMVASAVRVWSAGMKRIVTTRRSDPMRSPTSALRLANVTTRSALSARWRATSLRANSSRVMP